MESDPRPMTLPDGLMLGWVLDYSHLELGYNTVVMLLDRDNLALYRGRGNTEEEATAAAIEEWKEENARP